MIGNKINRDYESYVEIINIVEINIIHSGLKLTIDEFVKNLEIFERGVNTFSPYNLKYYISVESFCKNDSSFIVLKAMAGSFKFYEHSNELDQRKLEQMRLFKTEKYQVIFSKDFEQSLCYGTREDIFQESSKKSFFKLDWYKEKNGDRLIDFYPYFFHIYTFYRGKIVKVEDVFPDRIIELR